MNVARIIGIVWLIAIMSRLALMAEEAPTLHPTIVSVQSGNTKLKGLLFKPKGSGRFPAIIWNHSAPKALLESGPASRFNEMAAFFVEQGYVVFMPDRRARNLGFDEYEINPKPEQEAVALAVQSTKENLEMNHVDLTAAVDWLKEQPFVDSKKLAMCGMGSGAIQSIYEAGRSASSEMKAFVLFAPGSRQWNKSLFLRQVLPQSVQNSKAPMIIIQAQNDYGLEAMVHLSKQISSKGKPNKTIVYAPHGHTQRDAALFAMTGAKVWGDDVAAFLQETLGN